MAAVEVEILVGGGMEVSIALEVEVVGRRFVVSRRSDGRYGNDCGEYDVLSFPEAGKSSGRPAVEHTGNFEATLLVKEEDGGESRVSEFEAPSSCAEVEARKSTGRSIGPARLASPARQPSHGLQSQRKADESRPRIFTLQTCTEVTE
jgi:hypothetical protein